MKITLFLLALGFAVTASAQTPVPSEIPKPAPGKPSGQEPPQRVEGKRRETAAQVISMPSGPREAVLRNDSLLKVNATYQGYAPHIPWQRESPASRRGLGVVISGNRVLVTAQIVADATYIELELAESGQKFRPK